VWRAKRNPIVDERRRGIFPIVHDAGHLPTGVDGNHVLLNRTSFLLRRVRVELKSKAGLATISVNTSIVVATPSRLLQSLFKKWL
jgi:hypothetical protein